MRLIRTIYTNAIDKNNIEPNKKYAHGMIKINMFKIRCT